VLNDIGPVLEVEGLQQIQGYLGSRRAPNTFSEAAEILQATHGAEFPALGAEEWAGMARALYREIEGKLMADFDPRDCRAVPRRRSRPRAAGPLAAIRLACRQARDGGSGRIFAAAVA
jgi:hypothetical protein